MALIKTFITNIRGLQGYQGVQGVQGLSGTNGNTADAAVASYIGTSGRSETRDALMGDYASKYALLRPFLKTKTLASGQHNGFAHAVVISNGNTVLAWRAGANHAPSKGVIKVAIYTSLGATVMGATTAATDATYDLRDPVLTALADGRICLAMFAYNSSTDVPILDGARVSFSSDNGVTWSALAVVDSADTTWAALSGPAVETSTGILILPTYGNSTGSGLSSSRLSRSTDAGVTWAPYSVIANGATDARHYQEPNVVLTDRGDLLAVMRSDTTTSMWSARSSDGGATWSTPIPAFDTGSGAPRLTNRRGFIYAVYRNSSGGAPAVRHSGDSGITWSASTALPTGDSAFPVMAYGAVVPHLTDSLRYFFSAQSADSVTANIVTVEALAPADRTAPLAHACILRNVANYSLATSTVTSIPFTTEDLDTDGFHSASTNPSRITIPAGMGGVYTVTAGIYYAISAATAVQAYIFKNNAQVPGGTEKHEKVTSVDATLSVGAVLYLQAGDYIELKGYQDSGAAVNVRFESTGLSAILVGMV